MPFSIETPLSCVRSTINKTPFVDKTRRRPTFSLHPDINIARSFGDTSSQFTTPALSPSQSCILPPSPLDSFPRTPVTPADTVNQWDDRSPTESSSNFVAWRDDLHFAIPDSPTSSIRLQLNPVQK
ncbi:hypothetical protein RSAG8_11064, partial [Rhizoctonia solani AG-8 WAC10335]